MTFNLFRENNIFHEWKDDGGNMQNQFKVRGPFVQALCIKKDSYIDAI